mmetsp:Transcript_9877/g.20047  ORF Transcript_9877/g.20047 Transcript_9877/m.20047 type:complete len:90 (-) Transcript_9877:39-308(-)
MDDGRLRTTPETNGPIDSRGFNTFILESDDSNDFNVDDKPFFFAFFERFSTTLTEELDESGRCSFLFFFDVFFFDVIGFGLLLELVGSF